MTIFYDPRCLEYSSPGHPERPERIARTEFPGGALDASDRAQGMNEWCSAFDRGHSVPLAYYIAAIREAFEPATRRLGLTGTHVGCEHGVCGACTVLLDGEPIRACLMLAVQADGREIGTIDFAKGRGWFSALVRSGQANELLAALARKAWPVMRP